MEVNRDQKKENNNMQSKYVSTVTDGKRWDWQIFSFSNAYTVRAVTKRSAAVGGQDRTIWRVVIVLSRPSCLVFLLCAFCYLLRWQTTTLIVWLFFKVTRVFMLSTILFSILRVVSWTAGHFNVTFKLRSVHVKENEIWLLMKVRRAGLYLVHSEESMDVQTEPTAP